MAEQRFQYLLNGYKTGRLSRRERLVWQEMATSEEFRFLIESDIDFCLRQHLVEHLRRLDAARVVWKRIHRVIRLN